MYWKVSFIISSVKLVSVDRFIKGNIYFTRLIFHNKELIIEKNKVINTSHQWFQVEGRGNDAMVTFFLQFEDLDGFFWCPENYRLNFLAFDRIA